MLDADECRGGVLGRVRFVWALDLELFDERVENQMSTKRGLDQLARASPPFRMRWRLYW